MSAAVIALDDMSPEHAEVIRLIEGTLNLVEENSEVVIGRLDLVPSEVEDDFVMPVIFDGYGDHGEPWVSSENFPKWEVEEARLWREGEGPDRTGLAQIAYLGYPIS